MRLDAYDRRARLSPALVAALPLAVSVIPVLEGLSKWWAATAPLLAYAGVTYLLTQVARDRGKAIELRLWRSWGGSPTTRFLRHSGPSNPTLVKHRHARLSMLLPHLRFPSPDEEAANPEAADETYEAAAHFLRNATYDHRAFPLVFVENCNYGFRRNLLGLRPLGIGAAFLGLALVLGFSVDDLRAGETLTAWTLGPLAVDVAALVVWIWVATPAWVKPIADAYAERLLGAADQVRPARELNQEKG